MYWLFKSEPETYSWQRMQKEGITHWEGVRNYQARNYMKQMNVGDLGFFYHSVVGKEMMGIVEVASKYYPDHTDESGRFGMVDVKYYASLKVPVTLERIKAEPDLVGLPLLKQSRLSVMPIKPEEWQIIIEMGGGFGA
jgi:predicted RNA-binding protein with PUA-like domain